MMREGDIVEHIHYGDCLIIEKKSRDDLKLYSDGYLYKVYFLSPKTPGKKRKKPYTQAEIPFKPFKSRISIVPDFLLQVKQSAN